MTPTAESNTLTQQLAETLKQRQMELRALLQSAAGAVTEHPSEVVDFKDVAAEETRAAIDEMAYSHALHELRQVAAALRRIEDSTYGQCEDCGERIDERRLHALPATAFCTACQAIHERPRR